ncbi:MAG: hypothetical protein U0R19_09390 [Bryobacteraceae bacterium]
MSPYNFPTEQFGSTSNLKVAQPQPETPAQPAKPAKRKVDPLNPFADWPEEVMLIINRYSSIRLAMIDALNKEVAKGTFV